MKPLLSSLLLMVLLAYSAYAEIRPQCEITCNFVQCTQLNCPCGYYKPTCGCCPICYKCPGEGCTTSDICLRGSCLLYQNNAVYGVCPNVPRDTCGGKKPDCRLVKCAPPNCPCGYYIPRCGCYPVCFKCPGEECSIGDRCSEGPCQLYQTNQDYSVNEMLGTCPSKQSTCDNCGGIKTDFSLVSCADPKCRCGSYIPPSGGCPVCFKCPGEECTTDDRCSEGTCQVYRSNLAYSANKTYGICRSAPCDCDSACGGRLPDCRADWCDFPKCRCGSYIPHCGCCPVCFKCPGEDCSTDDKCSIGTCQVYQTNPDYSVNNKFGFCPSKPCNCDNGGDIIPVQPSKCEVVLCSAVQCPCGFYTAPNECCPTCLPCPNQITPV